MAMPPRNIFDNALNWPVFHDALQGMWDQITGFQYRFYGSYATAPTTAPDGQAIQNGDVYYNSANNALYVYVGGWVLAVQSPDAIQNQVNTATLAASVAQAARDAAIINANVYVSTSVALADSGLSVGSFFKVANPSGNFAATEYQKLLSPNLFNTATVRADKFINSAIGVIGSLTGWGCSAFIPVVAGNTYTISATHKGRNGVAFYSSASDTAYVSGSYNGSTTLPLTVTAPTGAAFMVVNLYQATDSVYTNVQVELGSVATTYYAYDTTYAKQYSGYPSASYVSAIDTRVSALESATSKPYEQIIPSVNLFNTATVRSGYFVNSATGQISATSGWGCSAFIPVTAGQAYTISGTVGRQGIAFYSSASDTAYVSGSYNGSTTLPLTVTAPTGAAFMVINLYSPTVTTYSNVQVEQGSLATTYIPYGGSITKIKSSYLYPDPVVTVQPVLTLSQSGTSQISYPMGTDQMVIEISPFLVGNHSQSAVWNFYRERLNSVVFRATSDDVAPYRVEGTTIGANHGYAKTVCTVSAHGKSQVDVGSVWSSSGVQWVLIEVPDANTLTITARSSNNQFSAGTLAHVSGATNTASFTPSAVVQSQWYSPIQNRALSISIDGKSVTNYNASYAYSDNVTFAESYEIMNKSSIVEWLVAHVGSSTDYAQYGGTSDLSVSMSYVFDAYGACVIYTDFLALNNVPQFQDIMFTQAYAMYGNSLTSQGPAKYYLPKTLPFTQDGTSYDFRIPKDMTGITPPTRLNFTSEKCDATGQLLDRGLMLNDVVGVAIGYLPVLDAAPEVRRTNASNKAWQISEILKFYPACIDRLDKTSLNAGDYFKAVAYRAWFKKSSARTASYVIRSKLGTFLYCDWHASTTDRVQLPNDLNGKPFTIQEKSSSVTVLSSFATNSIAFQVALDSSGYAFACLKF